MAAVAALAGALAAAAVVLFVPLGSGLSVEAVESIEGVEGIGGMQSDESAEAVSGTSIRSSYTLLEEEGPGLLVVLAIPVVLALAGVVGAVTQRAWLTTGAACLLFAGVLLGAASIGLFFVPAAIALGLAARWTAAGGTPETQ